MKLITSLVILSTIINMSSSLICDMNSDTDSTVWDLVSLVDDENEYLNLAFPDAASEYYISCFAKNIHPIFKGVFPEWSLYASLTAYDSNHNIINDCNIDTTTNNITSSIDLFENYKTPTHNFYVIFRIYSNYLSSYQRIQDDERFDVFVDNTKLKSTSTKVAKLNSKLFHNEASRRMKHMDIPIIYENTTHVNFKYCNHTNGLFPNPIASYMNLFPGLADTIKFVGYCPRDESVIFFDIVLGDYNTTETVNTYSPCPTPSGEYELTISEIRVIPFAVIFLHFLINDSTIQGSAIKKQIMLSDQNTYGVPSVTFDV